MRIAILLTAVALASFGSTQPGQAIEGPWCMHMLLGGGFVSNNCAMMTYEQCRANMPGAGAWCTQNPRYVAAPPPPRRKKTKRVYQ